MNYVTTAPVNEKGTEQESIQTRNNLNASYIYYVILAYASLFR